MSRILTPASSLQNLTREAKRLLKALRAGSAEARERLTRALEHPPALPTLRDVQHALAREFGLPGWAALRQALASPRANAVESGETALVSRFLDNACPDHHVRGAADLLRARHTALRLLTRFPELADVSFQTEIVCGDLDGVRKALADRPELATIRATQPTPERSGVGNAGDLDLDLGPKGWEPLLYLCYARLPLPQVEENAVAIATALLDAGANPNAYFQAGDCHFTALVGVIGEGEGECPPHPARDALAQLLLDRGADPYDNQVIYNIHFHGRVLWWLKLIHARSVVLGRQADWDDPEWPMLDMGGYGSGARWHLDIAIKHHDLELAEWCLTHGANPNSAHARSNQFPQYSLYETAMRASDLLMAELLVKHGAKVTPINPDPMVALATAAIQLDREKVMALLVSHPRLRTAAHPLFHLAEANKAGAVALLLDAGVPIEVENHTKQRALHMAAYSNALDVARLLIQRGAEIDPVERRFGGTPLGHASHAGNREMMQLLADHSRDFRNLMFIGRVDRVGALLAEEPERAMLRWGEETALMWLTTGDEAVAIETARLLLQYGADASVKNKEGRTAADRAESLGMYDLALVLRDAAPDQGENG